MTHPPGHRAGRNLETSMNAYEINLAIRGLQSLESELCREWEIAQKARPYGAKATGKARW